MLSEINQTEKGKYYMISHVESKIKQNTKILDTENRSVIARGKGLKGGEMGEGSQKVKRKKRKPSKVVAHIHARARAHTHTHTHQRVIPRLRSAQGVQVGFRAGQPLV